MNACVTCIYSLVVIVEWCTNRQGVAISTERNRGAGTITGCFAVDIVASLYPCRIAAVVVVDTDGSRISFTVTVVQRCPDCHPSTVHADTD